MLRKLQSFWPMPSSAVVLCDDWAWQGGYNDEQFIDPPCDSRAVVLCGYFLLLLSQVYTPLDGLL